MGPFYVQFELQGGLAESRWEAWRCEVCAALTTRPAAHADWHYKWGHLFNEVQAPPPVGQPHVVITLNQVDDVESVVFAR